MAEDEPEIELCLSTYLNGRCLIQHYGNVSALIYGDIPFHIAIDRLGEMLRVQARKVDKRSNVIIGIEVEADPYSGRWFARGTAVEMD